MKCYQKEILKRSSKGKGYERWTNLQPKRSSKNLPEEGQA